MGYKEFKTESEREESPESEAAELFELGRTLLEQSNPRRRKNLIHARLYGNADVLGFSGRDFSRTVGATVALSAIRIGYNVIGSVIEALNSKIGKMRPRPTFITDGGTWAQQQKSRKLTSFVQGWFHESCIYVEAIMARLDAYVFGTGALHLFIDPKTKKVRVERQFIDELFVDDVDGKYARPRRLFRRKVVDREALYEKFRKAKDADKLAEIIKNAAAPNEEVMGSRRSLELSDPVEVWEKWELGEEGCHEMAVSSGMLLDEDWPLDCFPFVIRRYRPELLGFWGKGVAEILTPIQVEMNRTLRSVSEQLRRKGRGRVYAPVNSIDKNQMDNSFGAIVFYKGAVPPTPDNAPAVSPDEVQHYRQLKADAYEEVGLSQLSATSKKPSGLDAAVAMREYNDIETERFALDAQADERMYMECAELALELIREFVPDYAVALPKKRYSKKVTWGEIRLKKGEYIGQMFPVSSLPSTPAARRQAVEELRVGTYIDMATAKKLLDYPDLEAELSLANAAVEDVDAIIGNILDEDRPVREPVDEFTNVPLLVERATAAFLFARRHGADEERLNMMRELIAEATAKMAAIAAASAPSPTPAAPGAAPALAPQGAGPSPTPGPALPPPVAPPAGT
jgi:hypothetical protein